MGHSWEVAVAETIDDVLDILTTQLARAVVEEIAPEELPPFDPISQAFIERRKEDRRKGRKQIDYPSELDWNEDLGFGMGEAVTLLTPAALAAAGAVVGYLAREVGQGLAKGTAEVVAEQLKRWIRGLLQGKPGPIRLKDAELARVGQIVRETARHRGVPKDRADQIADTVVARLATLDDR
jgi:hypothetical protein